MALLYMAVRKDRQQLNTKEIAAGTGVSEGYLEQLFIPLRRLGVIHGLRGPQGGYTLSRPPAEILTGDVLREMEGSMTPVDCVVKGSAGVRVKCPAGDVCKSRKTWSGLQEVISAFINSVTLQDLVDDYNSNSAPEYEI